jgi:hypothetical protein
MMRLRSQVTAITILVVAAWGVPDFCSAQRLQTIPERLAEAGTDVTHDHPVGGGIFGDPASAESIRRYNDFLVAHVDQIVRGIVGPAKPSYLSDNQQEVYTDYAIIDPVILYQAKVTTSTRPGVMPTATATIFGGTITIHT